MKGPHVTLLICEPCGHTWTGSVADQTPHCLMCGSTRSRALEYRAANRVPTMEFPVSAPPPHHRGRTTMKDCFTISCGTGVAIESGHLVVDGMIIKDTLTGFKLSDGVTADITNVDYSAPPSASEAGRRSWRLRPRRPT